jgi:ubiquinone/menaquinone biosynthesis C-methylase UbiE
MNSDTAFAGSIPALYDRCLGPLLFEPYAADLAERVRALAPQAILETAAGTGIVTRALAEAAPDARIVATDLNADMLALAGQKVPEGRVRCQVADAQALPFEDASFDVVVCQFGAMFFPDRIGAYREARRVLRPGGTLLMNVWDSLERNEISDRLARAVAALFPDDPPSFLQRVPFGYHDPARMEQDVRAAGFAEVAVERVEKSSLVRGGGEVAVGLVQGSPLLLEVQARGSVEAATRAAAEAVRPFEGQHAALSAWVVTARG